MLGRDLLPRLRGAGFNFVGVDIDELDITRLEDVLSFMGTLDPDLVINCAAYTAVDKAESEPDLAFAVNAEGPAHLAHACAKLKRPLIHISTDYVFDGSEKKAYREEDPVAPIGVYGQSKWKGEEAIHLRLREHLIVRTSWLYGIHGHNFVKTMLTLARQNEEFSVVADQYGCPTWTGDLSSALLTIAIRITENKKGVIWGTYHYCGGGHITWYDFARAIVEEGRQRESLRALRVVPIKSCDYPTPAKRPMWSVLDCSKIHEAFHIKLQSWEKGLTRMLDELYCSPDSPNVP